MISTRRGRLPGLLCAPHGSCLMDHSKSIVAMSLFFKNLSCEMYMTIPPATTAPLPSALPVAVCRPRLESHICMSASCMYYATPRPKLLRAELNNPPTKPNKVWNRSDLRSPSCLVHQGVPWPTAFQAKQRSGWNPDSEQLILFLFRTLFLCDWKSNVSLRSCKPHLVPCECLSNESRLAVKQTAVVLCAPSCVLF